jgi:hypothetical protein
MNKAYHLSSLALIGMAPIAVMLSPSPMNLPIDYAFAFILPIHRFVRLQSSISIINRIINRRSTVCTHTPTTLTAAPFRPRPFPFRVSPACTPIVGHVDQPVTLSRFHATRAIDECHPHR